MDTNPLPVPPTCLLPRGPPALLPLNWCHRPSKVQGNWADQPPPQHHNTPGPPMAAATCHSGHHNTPGPSMAAATCHSVHHSPSPPQCRPTMATPAPHSPAAFHTGPTAIVTTVRSPYFYSPTPLTGCKYRLVPWRNSFLLFILVSGSRW